jgi:hypothetical protein
MDQPQVQKGQEVVLAQQPLPGSPRARLQVDGGILHEQGLETYAYRACTIPHIPIGGQYPLRWLFLCCMLVICTSR